MPLGAEQSGFQLLFSQLLNYAFPIAQLIYMLGLLVVAAMAYRQFKRFVDFKVGAGPEAAGGQETMDISVDEFVD